MGRSVCERLCLCVLYFSYTPRRRPTFTVLPRLFNSLIVEMWSTLHLLPAELGARSSLFSLYSTLPLPSGKVYEKFPLLRFSKYVLKVQYRAPAPRCRCRFKMRRILSNQQLLKCLFSRQQKQRGTATSILAAIRAAHVANCQHADGWKLQNCLKSRVCRLFD